MNDDKIAYLRDRQKKQLERYYWKDKGNYYKKNTVYLKQFILRVFYLQEYIQGRL